MTLTRHVTYRVVNRSSSPKALTGSEKSGNVPIKVYYCTKSSEKKLLHTFLTVNLEICYVFQCHIADSVAQW